MKTRKPSDDNHEDDLMEHPWDEQPEVILNTAPCGIAVIEVNPNDVEGSLRTLYINECFCSCLGYSREEYETELKGRGPGILFGKDAGAFYDEIQNVCAGEIDNSKYSSVRCYGKNGDCRWLLFHGRLVRRDFGTVVIKTAVMDITAQKEIEHKLLISEELLRIALENDMRLLIDYNVKENTCRVESRNLFSAKYGDVIDRIPESLVEAEIVSKESVDDIYRLFARIRNGEVNTSASLLMRTGMQEYQWFECNASTMFDASGSPDHAMLVFHNISEERVKEAVFSKWRDSIKSRPRESYALFRTNLSKDSECDEQDGELLKIRFAKEVCSFNERSQRYADQFVYPADKVSYLALLKSETLLEMFYHGEHIVTMEYREIGETGEPVWRLLTVEMVEYPNSTDVQAFMLFENINEKKREEQLEIELMERDPLTGVLNRVAFSTKVDSLIQSEPCAQHAMLMMDMDGFKQINDTFGHAAGDQVLIDTSAIIRTMIREDDLACRLGGDEFLVWLRKIPYDAVIEKIAKQICDQVRKSFSEDVKISASIGIAVYPRDGQDFDELYHNADKALYKVKKSGKDNYTFAGDRGVKRLDEETPTGEKQEDKKPVEEVTDAPKPGEERAGISNMSVKTGAKQQKPRHWIRRRMLIVDDSSTTRVLLHSIFKDEYLIETAKNGTEAMMLLRHFSTAISIVLLDLIMPGMDGYEVLRKMQENTDLRTIPVVVVSGDEDRTAVLKAIEDGAADYVTKPIDRELIQLRVKSAISKTENERLRAQNSYLLLQRDEEMKFHTVLESTGTVVVEYDWHNHVFIYANDIQKYIAGTYNHRSMWLVFLSDLVANSADVKGLQDGLLWLANNRDEKTFTKLVMLKTPAGPMHWFRMNIYKQSDTYGLAEKMIITFNDVHEEVVANEKLLFQATRDELTGIYNRAGFIKRASEMIADREPGYYTMSCTDIEKFRVINDLYGTKRGDQVLRGFAAVLQKLNGGNEVICCRVMADHFAVLFPSRLVGTDELMINHNDAERLDSSLPHLRMYVGRCVVDDKLLPVSAIYDRACMAKETVKGRYDTYVANYSESMRTAILRQQKIIGQMKTALSERQFEVFVQPQINHRTGEIYGAEALVRWRHPKEGLIMPCEFISIFERNGFIYEIDRFVWESVCKYQRNLMDRGKNPVPVSVNVSRYDVFRDDCIDVITKLVKKYNLQANMIRLEITETAFSESTSQIIQVVDQMVSHGFTVEIDDFGSGYSSLNTLKDVPAQVLKMDMRFLENEVNAKRGSCIIESVVQMAHKLDMAVIAEGVETKEQADYLSSIGCELVQGYYYAKPMPWREYEEKYVK